MSCLAVGVRRVALLAAASLFAVPAGLWGQQSRSELLQEARRQYDNFQETQTIELLREALNPEIGAPDADWNWAVQLMAQILLRNGQEAEATAWLRWAARLNPDMQVDSINFIPAVVTSFYDARNFVRTEPADSTIETTWEWSTRAGGFGDLRVESDDPDRAMRVVVEGVGFFDVGQGRTLAPGSYRIVAQAGGLLSAEATTEVLPGITTVVTVGASADPSVIVASAETNVRSRLVRVTARRLSQQDCAAGILAGSNGLLLTSYRAIRGAETLEIQLPDGRRVTDGITVAAYDVRGDVAILSTPADGDRGVQIATDAARDDYVWAFHYPSCGGTATMTRLQVAAAGPQALGLTGQVPESGQSGPVVNRTGAVVGLAAGPQTAIPTSIARRVMTEAATNLAAGQTRTAMDVARRENHLFGEVALQTATVGAMARVSPLESWHWPETERSGTLPFNFAGPMGRYRVEVLVAQEIREQREINIQPGQRLQIALGAPGGKFPIAIPIVGVVGAGAAVALLAGGGGGGGGNGNGNGAETGSITITFPNTLRAR